MANKFHSRDYRVDDGSKFKLSKFDPDDSGPFESREEAEEATHADILKLRELHEKFFIDNRRALLIVFQAMDTGGKDGCIKHVFTGVNPVGCQVASFKAPNSEEAEHDFLWRIHRHVPPRGNFGILNRSHYEDVLVVRVHDLVPKKQWSQRYLHINAFEKMLSDEHTLIVKFFLNISKGEQKERLQARLDDPKKNWKFDEHDLDERKHWNDYMAAYEAAVRNCSAPHAPWYVVPADKKWFRNYVVANALVDILSDWDYQTPKPKFDPAKVKVV